MKIQKMPSGGRGEYEVTGLSDDGLSPEAIRSLPIWLELGNLKFGSNVVTGYQGEKNRIRLNPKKNPYHHLHIQLARLLMMPDPIRDERKLQEGSDNLRRKGYLIDSIDLDHVVKGSDCVTATVKVIDIVNASTRFSISADQRLKSVDRVWDNRSIFPKRIKACLDEHYRIAHLASPVDPSIYRWLRRLEIELQKLEADERVDAYIQGTDILPYLETLIPPPLSERPTDIDSIDPSDVKLRQREINRWRKYADRGYAGVRFRKNVQRAYDYRCIICGLRLPPTSLNAKPGVDSAHIVAWSEADLDEVHNGLALCKQHHWAFDEGLLAIAFSAGRYSVIMPPEVHVSGNFKFLEPYVGPIPDDRLPKNFTDRPDPGLLNRYNEAIQKL